jgi:integrase
MPECLGDSLWGEYRLSAVRTVEVESWLRGLSLANATKAKVRNVMHVIFAHACRHEWLMRNPISLERQSAKRTKTPDVLDAEELKKLLTELQNPACAVVFLTAGTGLRISEALGLKWSDVDFNSGLINLSRAVVHQHVGEMKTEASQKPVPMDGALAGVLQYWSTQTWYRQPDDWVFASSKMHGKTSVLAGNAAEMLGAARSKTRGHHKANRLALVPQDVCNASKGQR